MAENRLEELELELADGLVRVVVLLPPGLVVWLDELRAPAHTSRGNQVRIELATRRREQAANGSASP
jgi:hypothetical protein